MDEKFQTNIDGIFSCGNSLFVNDLVDNVTEDAYIAAEKAFDYLNNKKIRGNISVRILPGENIAQIIPQIITSLEDVSVWVRAKKPFKNADFDIYPDNKKDTCNNNPENGFKGKILFSKRLRYVFPGELIKIKISKENLKNITETAGESDIKASINIK